MDDPMRLKYSIEVRAEKVQSELVVVIALLEELRKRHPKIYPIAAEAIEKAHEGEL